MLMGIDIGTTNVKVSVYDSAGNLQESRAERTPVGRHADGTLNYLPEGIWHAVAKVVSLVVDDSDYCIDAVSITGMAESGVLLDIAGQPVYPAIPWYDEQRTVSCLAAARDRVNDESWYRITGLLPSGIHSVFKWMWIAAKHPEQWKKGAFWLSIPDYIAFQLTGTALMSDSQAVRTMAFDVAANDWSELILSACGLTKDFLGSVVPAGYPVGMVSPQASNRTSLPAGTPVVTGGHDHVAAALGCGALDTDVVLDSFGTSEAVTIGMPRRILPQDSRGFAVGPHVALGYGYLMGGLYSSGGTIEWLSSLLGFDSFEAFEAAAEGADPSETPLFISDFFGAGPPFNVPGAKGAFHGLGSWHSKGCLARSVLEGVAFQIRSIVAVATEVTGRRAECVRLVGTAGRSKTWNTIRASVIGLPLEVIDDGEDMATRGAAMIAGIGVGLFRDSLDALGRTTRRTEQVKVNEKFVEIYENKYEHFERVVSMSRELATVNNKHMRSF